MDVTRINELLKENNQIKIKIVEIKRKLNLKNYTEQQKEEFKKIISSLKEMYRVNQEKCSTLSSMKATSFAKLVCKILNRENSNKYEVALATLNYPEQSITYNVSKHFRNESKGVFLVVTNRKINEKEVVSLDDPTLIPIAYSSSFFYHNMLDEYTFFVMEQEQVSLFESQDLNEVFKSKDGIKLFNLGFAGEKEKTDLHIAKLRESVMNELGILTNTDLKKVEKQLL